MSPSCNIIPDVHVLIPFLNQHCTMLRNLATFQASIYEDWVKLAVSDAAFLNGLFLPATRHLSMMYPQDVRIRQFTMLYKVQCLRALEAAVSSEAHAIQNLTVAKAMSLALDEVSPCASFYALCRDSHLFQVMLGNIVGAATHVRGIVKLAESSGGVQALRLNGFLESLLHRFVYEKNILQPNVDLLCVD